MSTKVYQAYLNRIQHAINEPNFSLKSSDYSNFTGAVGSIRAMNESVNDLTLETGLASLKALLGKTAPLKISAGDHPDFINLRNGVALKEQHYIVSVFIDVKNSTSFFRKYNHDQIALIIQTIQRAAIHTCSLFEGHIQRQQYDGLFAYFGGKKKSKVDAIDDALKAVSFFTYFMKYELPEIFGVNDLDNIYTRAGIDFGDDNEVSWYVFGVDGCSELTTVSLHTSLAPKMQSCAGHNGIMIGNNIISKVPNIFGYSSIRMHEGQEVPNAYERPTYKQFEFDWQKFLLDNYPFVKKAGNSIEVDYDYKKRTFNNSFYEKIETLKQGASISPAGFLTKEPAHKIAETKFYGHE